MRHFAALRATSSGAARSELARSELARSELAPGELDTAFPWLVLTTWAVGGALLSVLGHFRMAGAAEPDREAAVAT